MGYDLHITRKADWSDDAGPLITPDEWLALVDADRELEIYENGINGPYFVRWLVSTEREEQWLDLDVENGDIHTKNPDDALIDKMLQISKLLEAKVQGDDGEVHSGGGQVVN